VKCAVVTGVNPQSVRGSRTGVFIGCSASEAHDAWTADAERVTGYEMTGCTRSMFANRLSYFFDFRGLYFDSLALFQHWLLAFVVSHIAITIPTVQRPCFNVPRYYMQICTDRFCRAALCECGQQLTILTIIVKKT